MNSRTAYRVRPQIGDRPLPRTHCGLGSQVSPSHPIPYPLPSFLPYPNSWLCLQSRSQRPRSFLDGFQTNLDCEAARRAKRGRHQSRAWPFACLAFCSTDYRTKRNCSQSKPNLIIKHKSGYGTIASSEFLLSCDSRVP